MPKSHSYSNLYKQFSKLKTKATNLREKSDDCVASLRDYSNSLNKDMSKLIVALQNRIFQRQESLLECIAIAEETIGITLHKTKKHAKKHSQKADELESVIACYTPLSDIRAEADRLNAKLSEALANARENKLDYAEAMFITAVERLESHNITDSEAKRLASLKWYNRIFMSSETRYKCQASRYTLDVYDELFDLEGSHQSSFLVDTIEKSRARRLPETEYLPDENYSDIKEKLIRLSRFSCEEEKRADNLKAVRDKAIDLHNKVESLNSQFNRTIEKLTPAKMMKHILSDLELVGGVKKAFIQYELNDHAQQYALLTAQIELVDKFIQGLHDQQSIILNASEAYGKAKNKLSRGRNSSKTTSKVDIEHIKNEFKALSDWVDTSLEQSFLLPKRINKASKSLRRSDSAMNDSSLFLPLWLSVFENSSAEEQQIFASITPDVVTDLKDSTLSGIDQITIPDINLDSLTTMNFTNFNVDSVSSFSVDTSSSVSVDTCSF